MNEPQNKYASDFPIAACPQPVQEAAYLLNSSYGLPLGTAAMMSLTTALAGAGNRRTLHDDINSPKSASLFTIVEMPAGPRAESAMKWISEPVWGRRCCLQADHIVVGNERIWRTLHGQAAKPNEKFRHELLREAMELLNLAVLRACPHILLENVDRLPVWRDAVEHSFDRGLFSPADYEKVLSLHGMTSEDRQKLLQWLRRIWTDVEEHDGSLPVQVALLWQFIPEDAAVVRHMLFEEGETLPAFVVPWRELEAGELSGESLSGDRSWDNWITSLLDRRASPEFTFSDFSYRGYEEMLRLQERFHADHLTDPDVGERATETGRRLAILFASIADNQTVEKEHVQRAALIAQWLVDQHVGWMAASEFVDVPPRSEEPEDALIRVLNSQVAITPDRVHRLLSGTQKLRLLEIEKEGDRETETGIGPAELPEG